MITKENLQVVLESLGFVPQPNNKKRFKKTYHNNANVFIEVDFGKEKITYSPLDSSFKEGEYPNLENKSAGFIIHRNTTTNFSSNENFVCLIAIDKLLSKGYEPKHIILEPTFKIGHNQQVYGDILVLNQQFENLILIENKTYGGEFKKEWNLMLKNGGQLFSYYAVNKTDFLCLLAFDYEPSLKSLIYASHIITTKDNQKHLKIINTNLKEEDKKLGFEDSKNANAKDYFKVWNESYSLAYTSKGLFEEDILPYKIGKEKYTLKDLSVVPYSEISGIYHSFATILRNNAIGNYENTFYILVDLFLCKIIDEIENPQDLQFYYKGIFYDNPFSYCDRLLNLYEKGIEKLFKKKVVNVQKSEIDYLFETAKRHKGKFKESIEKIFDKQKYFNIKKFNFIEVENEEEFFINFKVLVQITNLIQDFYISKSENNQFLGDLFEGFLNRAVHQTEGRFFTPTPITNFIINSLPSLNNNVKILDFACGAGHFLTEFIAHNKNAKLYGIEKNKDLSKVAKTACIFHNPKSKSQIIFQDALYFIKESYKDEFENESFDLILSNPPYSVKGFLANLEKALNAFSLSQSIDSKSYDKNNAIECFFIERAKHFLKESGILALVLPVSILQKGGIYEKTREILLSSFEILALVELNSRTFGSTGTQTIILFAKRVEKYDEDLINKLKSVSFCDEILSKDFEDSAFLQNYCAFMGYGYEDFKVFMSEQIVVDDLQNTGIFKGYFADFYANKPKRFKKQKIKENDKKFLFEQSSFFKSDLEPKEYRKLLKDFIKSGEYKAAEKDLHFKNFLTQIKELEFEKILYFAYIQKNNVLILKSPNDKNQEGKSNKANIVKFLGYDWSKRKGDEGIKYITNKPIDEELKESDEDSDEEKKQKEVLRNINSVKFIDTPLYNPNDKEDKTKLCYALKVFMENHSLQENNDLDKNFNLLLESLQSQEANSYTLFASSLKDMLDFTKVEFDKVISLNPAIVLSGSHTGQSKVSNPFANSKYELVRLGEILLNIQTAKRPQGGVSNYTSGALSLGGEHIDNKSGYVKMQTPKYVPMEFYENFKKQDKGIVKQNDILLCKDGALTGKVALVRKEFENQAVMINEHIFLLRCENLMTQKYMFFILHSQSGQEVLKSKITGSAQGGLNLTNLKELKIPLPPLEIQKQIVEECEKVEEQYNTIRMSIEEYQKLIKAVLVKCGICEAQSLESANNGGGYKLSFSSLDSIESFIAQTLAHIAELESKLDWELLFACHSEALAEESKNLEESQQDSFSQKEKGFIPSPLPLAPKRTRSPLFLIQGESLANPLLAKNRAGDTTAPAFPDFLHHEMGEKNAALSIKALLESLPTPPKEGWDSVKLGEVCKFNGGNGFPKEYQGNKDSTQTPFIKVSDMNLKENEKGINISNNYVTQEVIKTLSLRVFPKNTIVFPKVGMAIHTNKKRILKVPCIVDNNIMGVNILDNKKDELNNKFLFIIFNFFIDLKDIASSANPPSINNSNLNTLQIPLPPLKAQEKIVSVIENIESKIAKIDSTLENLEKEKANILNKSLNTERERERERDNKKLKIILNKITLYLSQKDFWQNTLNLALQKCGIKQSTTQILQNLIASLPQIPVQDWERVKLGEVCEILRGVTYDKAQQNIETTQNIILTADNITLENTFELSKMIYLKENFQIDKTKKLVKNDIFMCFSSGSLKHIGKVAFIKNDTFYYAGGFMGILRSFENIKAKFLFCVVSSKNFKLNLENLAKGANINNLSSEISNLQIPLPPLEIQEQIVSVVEDIEFALAHLDSFLSALESQKQAILKEALIEES
ncbi:restriction endonuclease subunit S [Campylobacter sp. MIT 21-1684]|uniref:restriction endonuclease subunit S n=1 Tax=Campylobacter sp. MIT 21-1684 TaxID=2994322 RepID=UPI00224ACCDC|nr:restriction endonuclease subunit S [Campylobacter sp. MIT 21-1684]MCX2683711.1 restriction endonuclease subunit S [Campylobacter sp. MIT 21-1684]